MEVAANAPLLWPLVSEEVGITVVGGIFTFSQAGIYEIDANVTIFQAAAPPEDVDIIAFLNGATALLQSRMRTSVTDAGDLESVSVSFLVSIAAGDTLDIRNISVGPRQLQGYVTVIRIAP